MTKEDMQVAYERILQERVDLVRMRRRTPEQEQRLLDLEAMIAFSPTSDPLFERFMREFRTPEDASRITITLHPDRDVTRLEIADGADQTEVLNRANRALQAKRHVPKQTDMDALGTLKNIALLSRYLPARDDSAGDFMDMESYLHGLRCAVEMAKTAIETLPTKGETSP